MALGAGDMEKVPSNLSMHEIYDRIYRWHKKNSQTVNETAIDPNYRKRYLQLVDVLPISKQATKDDIYLVCLEVITGLMEWAYHKEDNHGVKTAAYAHFVTVKFGGGFENLHHLAQGSKLSKFRPT